MTAIPTNASPLKFLEVMKMKYRPDFRELLEALDIKINMLKETTNDDGKYLENKSAIINA